MPPFCAQQLAKGISRTHRQHLTDGCDHLTGWGNIMTIIKKLWSDTSGASAAEYALILAIVGTGIALAALALGSAINTAMGTATLCITAPSSTQCGTAVTPSS